MPSLDKCARCTTGSMLYDRLEEEYVCHACGHRVPTAAWQIGDDGFPLQECANPSCHRPRAAKRIRCEYHLERMRESKAQQRAALKAAGKCYNCRQENDQPEKTHCSACAESERNAKYRRNGTIWHERKAAGVCPRCGGEMPPGYAYCERCRIKKQEATLRRREERRICPGLTSGCHGRQEPAYKMTGRKHCYDCLLYQYYDAELPQQLTCREYRESWRSRWQVRNWPELKADPLFQELAERQDARQQRRRRRAALILATVEQGTLIQQAVRENGTTIRQWMAWLRANPDLNARLNLVVERQLEAADVPAD